MKYLFIVSAMMTIGCHINNKKNTQKVDYYENEQVKTIKNYEENILTGPSFWFYPNGKLEQSVMFINGKAEGHAYIFYESGALKSRRIYKNGKIVGYSEDYFDHSIGFIKTAQFYNDSGQLYYRQVFDTSGAIIKEEGQRK
jgi:antitoxin component YwqK of YwqJK toxin-antitoxin module